MRLDSRPFFCGRSMGLMGYWHVDVLPTAWAAEAMRSVMIRGWDLTMPVIWQGLCVVAGWIVALLLLAIVLLRTRD